MFTCLKRDCAISIAKPLNLATGTLMEGFSPQKKKNEFKDCIVDDGSNEKMAVYKVITKPSKIDMFIMFS